MIIIKRVKKLISNEAKVVLRSLKKIHGLFVQNKMYIPSIDNYYVLVLMDTFIAYLCHPVFIVIPRVLNLIPIVLNFTNIVNRLKYLFIFNKKKINNFSVLYHV